MGKRGGVVRVKQMGPKMPPPMPTMEDFTLPPEELLMNLPPTPDRSYQVIWPIMETFTMKFDDFRVIYPSYLDSNKTCQQGRRLPKHQAVPQPTCADISQALQSLQIRHVLQPYKGYSRDITCLWNNPGRVLVDVSKYKRAEIMVLVASRIPDLPIRKMRLEQEAAAALALEEERKQRMLLKETTSVAAANKKSATKKGKKGRKK